jgi:type II secretory pathway component GspD/PulD (secretin)/tetratricopeptide (TPR) repeat protein
MMKPVTFSLALTLLLAAVLASKAQMPPQETAVNEAVYRQANHITLREKLADGRAAQERGARAIAAKLYDDAWDLVQKIGSGVEAEREQTIAGLAAARLELARAAQRHGDYKEAGTQVDDVLRVDPTNAAAIEFKSGNEKLLAEQRGTIPSEEVRSQVPAILEERVKAETLVRDGKLFYEMNKLEEADFKLKLALKQDPHNEAALYYLNLVSEAKFVQAAKDHEKTMRQDIRQVEQAWASPVKRELLPVPNPYSRSNNLVHTGLGRQTIISKLDRIRLDKVNFDRLVLSEVVNYLSEQSRNRDPDKRGINFLVSQNVDTGGPSATAAPQLGPDGQPLPSAPQEPLDMSGILVTINPALYDIRLADVLDAIVKVADRPIKYSIEDYAIVFSLKAHETTPLYVRTFKVDPNTFYQGLQGVGAFIFGESQNVGQNNSSGGFGGSSGGGGGSSGGSSGSETVGAIISRVTVAPGTATGGRSGGGGQQSGAGGGLSFITRTNNMVDVSRAAINYFETLGVHLDPAQNPGKALFFNDRQGMLVVRATMEDLDIVEAAIQILNIVPPQVNIKAKFVEIAQNDQKALGFDWFLGNTLMNNGTIGAQAGSAPSYSTPTYGSGGTAGNPAGLPFPSNGGAPGGIPQSATDGQLTSGLRSVGSPLFTLTGILTDPQFRVVISALQQRDGSEILAQPEVTTTSGRQAQMKATDVKSVITGFSFSQTQNAQAGGNGQTIVNPGATIVYPLPEQMELGPILDVIPCVLSDGFTINLTLIPTITSFVGYDNPNEVLTSGVLGNSSQGFTLVPTVLPRFTVRQVVSTVNVWDGQTVVLGGLLSETVTTIKDQVPMLGDLPLVGRLFRNESKTTQKSNLLIFVTPLLIDPAGNRLHTEDEMPFAQSAFPIQPPAAAGQERN